MKAAMDRRTRRSGKIVGEHLASWRKLLNLTSQQVADRAGISRTTLSKLENGGSAGNDAFLAVARSLGILDRIVEATNPWQSDLGRLRAERLDGARSLSLALSLGHPSI